MFRTATPFPQRALPTLIGRNEMTVDVARTTAMLLYFDSVTFNLFDPRVLFDRFDVAGAQEALTRLRAAADDGTFNEAVESTTLHEYLSMTSNFYFGQMEDFLKEWQVLFDEGILRGVFWDQGDTYEDDGRYLDFGPIVKWWFDHDIEAGFLDRYGGKALDVIADPLRGSLSVGGVAQLFHDYLLAFHPADLSSSDLATKERRLRQLWSLDVMFNSIFAYRNHSISESDEAFKLFSCVPERASDDARDLDSDAAALLSQTLLMLPLPLPRSAEAIAEIRHQMKDELAELRERLREIVEGASGSRDTDSLARLASEKLLNPQRALRRRLARPNRQLARNLVSQAGVVSAVIGVATSMNHGVDFWGNVLITSIAVGTAAVKTKIDQDRAVEESGVAFLFKSVRP